MVEIFHNFIPQSHYTLASAQLMSKNVNSLGLKTIRANLEFPDFALKINTRGQFFARIFQNALFCSNYLIATKVTSNYICSSIEPKQPPLSEHFFTAILRFARGYQFHI